MSPEKAQTISAAVFIGLSTLTLVLGSGLLLASPSSIPSLGLGGDLFAPVGALASLLILGAFASWRQWIPRSPAVFTMLGGLATALVAAAWFAKSALDALGSLSGF